MDTASLVKLLKNPEVIHAIRHILYDRHIVYDSVYIEKYKEIEERNRQEYLKECERLEKERQKKLKKQYDKVIKDEIERNPKNTLGEGQKKYIQDYYNKYPEDLIEVNEQ